MKCWAVIEPVSAQATVRGYLSAVLFFNRADARMFVKEARANDKPRANDLRVEPIQRQGASR